MIVVAREYGQLGNRLWLYAHAIAAAEEYGVSVANPCFNEYANLFPRTARDPWCRYPLATEFDQESPIVSSRHRALLSQSTYLAAKSMYLARFRRFPAHVLRLRNDQSLDMTSPAFEKMAKSNRHTMLLGWLFRCQSFLEKHATKIRDHFQLHESDQIAIDRFLSPIQSEADLVVGVHIRHGDYATFLGGRYFFPVSDYVAAMHEIQQQLAPRRVAFMVCSNAEHDAGDFHGLNVHFGPGHLLHDMYAFAKTDLIIGPPSTYTGWAAFYGNVPRKELDRDRGPIDLKTLQSTILGRPAA
ncbi:O-fucosyltransferase family protein [Novipirellula artificiosorum]|uniref:Glycosyl transferase family 11 n=1 Tax=Novipirellula artificiosorum TaxID=2528016 RepID=A0A5C6DAK3_9BACT|nr:hypothetical protein [Novipirellula artificiosorum]TWU32266.1 hypothetical protein Poly41_57510 [Novipirellula artificiosorum]